MTFFNNSMPQQRQPWYKLIVRACYTVWSVRYPVMLDLEGFVLSRRVCKKYRFIGRLSFREFLLFWTVMVLLFVSLVVSTITLVKTLRTAEIESITTAEISNIAAYNNQPPRYTISLQKPCSNFRNKHFYVYNANITKEKDLVKQDFCKQNQKNISAEDVIENNMQFSCYYEKIKADMPNNEEYLNSRPVVPPLNEAVTRTSNSFDLHNVLPLK